METYELVFIDSNSEKKPIYINPKTPKQYLVELKIMEKEDIESNGRLQNKIISWKEKNNYIPNLVYINKKKEFDPLDKHKKSIVILARHCWDVKFNNRLLMHNTCVKIDHNKKPLIASIYFIYLKDYDENSSLNLIEKTSLELYCGGFLLDENDLLLHNIMIDIYPIIPPNFERKYIFFIPKYCIEIINNEVEEKIVPYVVINGIKHNIIIHQTYY